MRRETPRWRVAALGAVVLLSLTTAACGGGGDSSKVASLGDKADESGGGDGGGQGGSGDQVAFEDAMLAYAQCMREHGVDMPDPTFSEDGMGAIAVRSTDAGEQDPTSRAFEGAAEACDPIMEDARNNMPQPSAEEQAQMQDDMLEMAACMREHGIDMPDPTFDDNGSVTLDASGPAGPADGPSDSNSAAAGIPAGPDGGTGPRVDPAFEAALEACQGEGMGPGNAVFAAPMMPAGDK